MSIGKSLLDGMRSSTVHIADDDDDFVLSEQMIQRLIDNRQIAAKQRTAIATCEENRDTPTANLLEEILDEAEKRIWFLYEVSQGGHNMEWKKYYDTYTWKTCLLLD